MVLHTTGTCGLGSGTSWSSAWMGWACSPGSIAIDESDDTRHPGSSTPSTMGSTSGWTGMRCVELAVGQQVVDAHGVVALEAVGRRHRAEVVLEPQQVVGEGVEQVGLDGVGNDRVAQLGDAVDVLGDGGVVHVGPQVVRTAVGATGRIVGPVAHRRRARTATKKPIAARAASPMLRLETSATPPTSGGPMTRPR